MAALCTGGCVKEQAEAPPARKNTPSLRVMTLNIAHGRKLARQQVLVTPETIRSNLADIAAVIKREKPDVVAVQEVDGPSVWSGNVEHAGEIARLADLDHFFRGDHVTMDKGMWQVRYGTALLSGLPLENAGSHTFAPTPPTFRKGLVKATILIPEIGREVDIVSVHLDFLRKKARGAQVVEMERLLGNHSNPLVVMGDFNCQWEGRENTLRLLCEELGLRPYKPEVDGLKTFSSEKPRRRLDWILVSPELEFVEYEVLDDKVSDHLGVVAGLRFSDTKE